MTALSSKVQSSSLQSKWRLTVQLSTSILGGYLFANTLSIFFALALPDVRVYAVAYGLMLGMLVWALIFIWVFAHHSLWRGCGVIWVGTLVLALLSWFFASGATT